MAEEKFINKDGKEITRNRCLVYTRVMGYLSPTYRYNVGKKSEFYSRKYFSKLKASNHDFSLQYGNACGSSEFGTRVNLLQGAAKEITVDACPNYNAE